MSETPLAPFITVSRERVADCRIFRVDRVRRRSTRSGETHDYFQIANPDWVNVLALTPDDEVVFVRQERHGTETVTLEIPGGMVDEGETPQATAVRELAEETGYAGGEAVDLGWVHPNPALQGNRCHTFLVPDARLAGPARPDEQEEIEVVLIPRARLGELVKSGEVTHALVVSAFYLLSLSGR